MTHGSDQQERGGCWPTAYQELLLRAALLQREEATASWRAWNTERSIDELDGRTLHLLPQIYWNLRQLDPALPGLTRLKGTYRYTWYKNQELLQAVTSLLDELARAEIATIVMNDLALVLAYYKDHGRRPIGGVDILIHPADLSRTVDVMQQLGWRNNARSLERLLQARSALGVWKPQSAKAMVHWRAFDARTTIEDERETWSASVPLRLASVTSRALSPAHQLVLICGFGVHHDIVPPSQWVIDGVTLVRSSGSTLDWDRVVSTARSAHVARVVREALTYLRERFSLEVPREALQQLGATPSTPLERATYSLRMEHPTIKKRVVLHWQRHATLNAGGNQISAAMTFPRYLQQFWDSDHMWEVLVRGSRACVRRTQSS